MLNVSSSGIIEITRGDSMKLPIFINQGTELAPVRYSLTEADTLYFAVMEPNQEFEEADIKKVFTSQSEHSMYQDLYIKLTPTDTENLYPGKYYYTVKVKTENEDGTYDVATIVPPTEFYIMR